MIERAWNEYRGWAKRARTLQEASRCWTNAALACGVLAAVFGAAASQTQAGSITGRVLSFLAGVAAALTPILGRDILEVKREASWAKSRATAEAIKSECFRYAAVAGDYAGPNRDAAFDTRIAALSTSALGDGLTPLSDPVTNSDAQWPSTSMTLSWYRDHRLREQNSYYRKGQQIHERTASRLRLFVLATAIGAAVLGVAGSNFGVSWFAPWIGVLTTLGATIVAYGFMDRNQYLAGSYGAMTVRLSHVEAHTEWDLPTVVTTTEDLLQGEHAAWSDRIMKTIVVPAAPKTT
jgi:SMODS and SLOG-associating 2TM effector domain 1/Protein of unknown function (DUF4231)